MKSVSVREYLQAFKKVGRLPKAPELDPSDENILFVLSLAPMVQHPDQVRPYYEKFRDSADKAAAKHDFDAAMKFEEQDNEHKNHLVALKATMDKILDVASTAERALAYYISVRDFGQCSRWKDVEIKCKKLDPKSFVGLTSDGEKDASKGDAASTPTAKGYSVRMWDQDSVSLLREHDAAEQSSYQSTHLGKFPQQTNEACRKTEKVEERHQLRIVR